MSDHVATVGNDTIDGRATGTYFGSCSCGWRGRVTATRKLAVQDAFEHQKASRTGEQGLALVSGKERFR